CYTFIPRASGRPTRLVVGHTWGASVYDLLPSGKVELSRVLIGHEGEVMSVAASRDGNLLLSASRDQTIACWSLAPWKTQKELGVAFGGAGGRLRVGTVEAGSPGWEAGLRQGDEIVLVQATDDNYLYDPGKRYSRDGKVARLVDPQTNEKQ